MGDQILYDELMFQYPPPPTIVPPSSPPAPTSSPTVAPPPMSPTAPTSSPTVAPPPKEVIEVIFDLPVSDEYAPKPRQIEEGDVIPLEGLLSSMECSSFIDPIGFACVDHEREFTYLFDDGFEKCRLTHKPEYTRHLHDGSIEKCSKFIFGETPVECSEDEKECSYIILSKGTYQKKGFNILDNGLKHWPSNVWESFLESEVGIAVEESKTAKDFKKSKEWLEFKDSGKGKEFLTLKEGKEFKEWMEESDTCPL